MVQPVKWPCVRGNDATSLQFFSATDMGLVSCRNHCAEGGYSYFGAYLEKVLFFWSGSDELEKPSLSAIASLILVQPELDNVDGILDFDDCGGGYKPQSSAPSRKQKQAIGSCSRSISVYYTTVFGHNMKKRCKDNDQAAQDELQCDDATVSSDRAWN